MVQNKSFFVPCEIDFFCLRRWVFVQIFPRAFSVGNFSCDPFRNPFGYPTLCNTDRFINAVFCFELLTTIWTITHYPFLVIAICDILGFRIIMTYPIFFTDVFIACRTFCHLFFEIFAFFNRNFMYVLIGFPLYCASWFPSLVFCWLVLALEVI